MLIQNIKSRNLWLWGETVTPSSEISEEQQLQAEIQDLEHDKSKKINEFKTYSQIQENATDTAVQYQKELSDTNAKIKEKRSDLNVLTKKSGSNYSSSNNDSSVNNVNYTRSYTIPFKITALQSVDITWDNPIGESYGIKTNFLQAWHNKPVSIHFSGLSYIGAFGGQTVGDLAQINNSNKSSIKDQINKSNSVIENAFGQVQNFLTNTIQDITNSDSAEYAKGKYYTVEDDDIYQINKLMSLYGEGMFTNANADKSSSWIHLILENEPGSNGSNQYAAFVGHIRNFNYKERVDQPFMYDFTCQFIGEPTISEKVGQGQIEAKQDSSSLKLSLVTTNSGFSLGYGF